MFIDSFTQVLLKSAKKMASQEIAMENTLSVRSFIDSVT